MQYIIDTKPKIKIIDESIYFEIENKLKNKIPLTEIEKNTFLDYYISISRKKLAEYLNIDIASSALTNKCDLAQHIIGKLLEGFDGVIVYPKESQQVFLPECRGHSFLVCIIQKTPYLIDLTYRQFFLKENCTKDKFLYKGNLVLKTPDPGFFMMSDDINMQVASKIICDGYIKLDASVAKRYGDSFYFTKTGLKIHANINSNEYLNTLLKENYEYAVSDENFLKMYGRVLDKN